MKVLVLSVTAGQGHNSCGKAVVDACTRKGLDSVMVDTLLLSSKLVANSLDKIYITMTRHTPGLLKKMDDDMLSEKRIHSRQGTTKLIGAWFYKEIENCIAEYQPDAVVCTHVFSGVILTRIRRQKGLEIPLIGINTDFAMAPLWDETDLDLYVLAAEGMRNSVIKRGIPQEKLFCRGIPVHHRFASTVEKGEARRQLGILDKPTVLIMSGSMGFGKLPQVVESLDRLPMDLQMLVVCGRNEKMYQQLNALRTQKDVRVYGFVDNVEVMMDASDVLLTKPGGLTTSECLAKGIPLVILDPIPGLEERNSLFLVAQGAAILATDQYPPDDAVLNLLSDPQRLQQILAMQKKIGNAHSADDLCDEIIRMVEERGVRSGEGTLPKE